MLKRELVPGIVISNTCVKLYRNWIINEVARAGEHTNECTYVRTYSHTYVRDRPYIPSTTLLCEGIIRLDVSSESSARQRIHMKNQALFSSKDKSKKLRFHLLQFLFGALSVWIYTVCHLGFQFSIRYSLDKTSFFLIL